MKTRISIAIVVASLVCALGAHGQSTNSTVVSSSGSATPSFAPTAVAPNQFVYAQRLPSVTDLTNAATAQNITIDRIDQTSSQITAVYRYANGQINTVAYLLLPPAGAATASSAAPVLTPATPAPAVAYNATPRVVYYDDYNDYWPGYYPYYWYPPVAFRVGLGFNYNYGFRGGFGGYRGGFRR